MANRKRYCGIVSCENFSGTSNRERVIFQFPRYNAELQKAWTDEILKHQNIKQLSKWVKVCELHFREDQIIRGRRTALALGAVPTIFRTSDNGTMQPILEPRAEVVDITPIIPRLTYSNLKRPEQSTKTLSTTPTIGSQTSQIRQQTLIKVEQPDESEENLSSIDTNSCNENHNQNQNEQTSQSSGCIRCITRKLKASQLAADTKEFQKKCKLLKAKNHTLQKKIFWRTSEALRSGQIICHKRCELCLVMVTENQLREHLCAELTAIKCEYCTDTTFTSTMALAEHLSSGVHANMKFYKCSKCNLGFRMDALVKIHENLKHPQSPNTTTDTLYKCGKCDESSEQPLALVRHFQKYHPSEPEPPKGPFHECYICKCQLDCLVTVRRHLKLHVAARNTKCEICGNRFTSNELMEWHICGEDVKCSRIPCEYCDESFQSVAKCLQHLKTVHPDDQSIGQCRKCPRYFGMAQLKNLHEKYYLHPVKSFQCDICSRKWTSKQSFKRHMKWVHAGAERSFLCSVCGKCYKSRRNLRLHSTLHGDQTIQCPDCPAKFRNQILLKYHYQWHQNLKFKCNKCNQTYSRKRSLQKHIRNVHDKRPQLKKYECQFCDLKFEKSDKLKIHLRSHTGEKPFECEFCHNSYRYKGDLMKHMQIHVGDNLYKCDVCGKGFRYRADLKPHMFEHYKEDKKKREANNASDFGQ